jgi:hypothetical protein
MASHENNVVPNRRSLLKWSGALAGATGIGLAAGQAQPPGQAATSSAQQQEVGGLRKGMFSFMLASEQFRTPELLRLGAHASRAGSMSCPPVITCNHGRPMKATPGKPGLGWQRSVRRRMAGWGLRLHARPCDITPRSCPRLSRPLSHLYSGRVFLGVGSGEALNEQVATGMWPRWQERWDRLIEAITVIRQLGPGKMSRPRASITISTQNCAIRPLGLSRC